MHSTWLSKQRMKQKGHIDDITSSKIAEHAHNTVQETKIGRPETKSAKL